MSNFSKDKPLTPEAFHRGLGELLKVAELTLTQMGEQVKKSVSRVSEIGAHVNTKRLVSADLARTWVTACWREITKRRNEGRLSFPS